MSCQNTTEFLNSTISLNCNEQRNSSEPNPEDATQQVIIIIHSAIASLGIVANMMVIIAFLNHRKFRRKIPNIFIVNQVRNVFLEKNPIETKLTVSKYLFEFTQSIVEFCTVDINGYLLLI